MTTQQPTRKNVAKWAIVRGEVCYKSDADDQSFGMWCPVDFNDAENQKIVIEALYTRADLEATIINITKERDCWYEQSEMLQHQNDKAFDELHTHIGEIEATVKEQTAEIERLKSALGDGSKHCNDDTVQSELCEAVIDSMETNIGQGLHPYWKWAFRSGFTKAESSYRVDIAELRRQLVAAHEEIERLKALSVTNILVDIVPGDGSGYEIYARSLEDVESLLTRLSKKAEDYDLVTVPLRRQLVAAQLHIEQLREALVRCETEASGDAYALKFIGEALSAQPDLSALESDRQRVAEACAKVCANKADNARTSPGNASAAFCEDAIRSGKWKEYLK